MKSSNKVSLSLEVLEDRLALSGAFGGAIGAGAPSNTPFPFNGLTVQVTNDSNQLPGFQGSFNVNHLTFVPAPSLQSQLQTFQNQWQAFQSAQNAALNQYFSEIGSILHQLNASTFIIL